MHSQERKEALVKALKFIAIHDVDLPVDALAALKKDIKSKVAGFVLAVKQRAEDPPQEALYDQVEELDAAVRLLKDVAEVFPLENAFVLDSGAIDKLKIASDQQHRVIKVKR